MDFRKYIRTVADYPKPGILFRDVTTLLGDAAAFCSAVDALVAQCRSFEIDLVAGIEARGFIVGGAVAHQLGKGFVPVRKRGKLPWKTLVQQYELEYDTAVVEVHEDAVLPGQKVMIADDLIATGGTAGAAARLVRQLGGVAVGACFIVELPDLGGRAALEGMGIAVDSLCSFGGV